MVKIEMRVQCDRCPANELHTLEFEDKSAVGTKAMRQLRVNGWRFVYDQCWKLALVMCPVCSKKAKERKP